MDLRKVERAKQRIPIVVVREPFYVGGSICVSLPPEWFKAHDIKVPKAGETGERPALIIAANSDIRIANPMAHKELYDKVSNMVKGADLPDKEILKRLEEDDSKQVVVGRRKK